jgi:hypothetical protein
VIHDHVIQPQALLQQGNHIGGVMVSVTKTRLYNEKSEIINLIGR